LAGKILWGLDSNFFFLKFKIWDYHSKVEIDNFKKWQRRLI
jgi:hypothetical protein